MVQEGGSIRIDRFWNEIKEKKWGEDWSALFRRIVETETLGTDRL